ncbi:MAG TPA: hypothetical protein VK166_01210 [Chitinophagaceae bacterium]|nr:hypothetical protein [Chitinophagaceae bacterium]
MNKIFTTRHLLAGLMVGCFDIAAACIQYFISTGKNPQGVLMYVASGVFGKQAFEGGTMIVISGLIFHFMIAMSFTFLFFALVSWFPNLLTQKMLLVILYGIFMWAFVRFCIMPFSLINPPPFKLKNAAIAAMILMVCISLPLSLIAGRELKQADSQ